MFYKPLNRCLKLGKRLLLKRFRTALPNVALLRKRVKLKMISFMRNPMHFSKDSQIRIVKELLRNTLILLSKHAVPAINSDAADWRVSSVQKCVAEYLRAKNLERMI